MTKLITACYTPWFISWLHISSRYFPCRHETNRPKSVAASEAGKQLWQMFNWKINFSSSYQNYLSVHARNILLPTQVFLHSFCTRCRENWKYSQFNFFAAPGAKIETESWQFNQLFFINLLKTRFGYNHVSTPQSFIGAFWNIFRLLHDFYEFEL